MIRRMIGDLLAGKLDPTANLPAVCPIPAGGSLFGRFENRKTRTAIPIPAASKWRVFLSFAYAAEKETPAGRPAPRAKPQPRVRGLRFGAAALMRRRLLQKNAANDITSAAIWG